MKKTMALGAKQKDNFVVETVKFVKKEVGAVENKLKDEARSIAIQYAILGGALGVLVGIIGTAAWEKYATPASPIRPPQA